MNITIRAAESEDYPSIAQIYDHPLVVEQSSQRPYLGVEKISEMFVAQRENVIVVVAETSGTIVGYLAVHLNSKPRARHVAAISMAVHPDHQGLGVGSELMAKAIELADQWLNLVRLELTVYADNRAAIHLYRKYGFEVEGEARWASFKAGSYANLLYMARLQQST